MLGFHNVSRVIIAVMRLLIANTRPTNKYSIDYTQYLTLIIHNTVLPVIGYILRLLTANLRRRCDLILENI